VGFFGGLHVLDRIVTALVFWARVGPHLIGPLGDEIVPNVSGNSIAADRYEIGHVVGQLWERVGGVQS
jgi:hypothetical protein